MRIVLLPIAFGLTLGAKSAVDAASMVDTVSTMAHKATAPNLKDKSVENTYFSQSLKSAERKLDGAHWQNFDGDPITGSQSPQDCIVLGVSQHGDKVSVRYSADRGKHSFVVRYVIINEGGAWKINDIIYAPIGTAKGGSFRRMMTDPVKN